MDEVLHPDAAAFANSAMIRFLDYNDTHNATVGVGHPSDYIPAAMAQLGEQEIPGELILRAVLVGYEVFCRLTDATPARRGANRPRAERRGRERRCDRGGQRAVSQGAHPGRPRVRARWDRRVPVAVEVGTFELGKTVMAGDAEKWHPATRETADHSIPYVVACALARGTVNREDLDESQLADPEIRRLLDVLTVEVDAECMAAWPEACMNRITIAFADGSQESAVVRYYREHAKNPMSDRELEGKFRGQAASVITDADADALVKAI